MAGNKYYKDMWTRDAFFACLGLLLHNKNKNKSYNIVKQYLLLLSKFQKENGLIPLRIGRSNKAYFFKTFKLKIDNKDRGVFRDDKNFSYPTDSNP